MFWGQAVGGSNPPSPTHLDRGGQLRSPRRLNSVASADTTPAARAVQISVYRRLSPSERVALALSMSEDVRAIANAGAASRRMARERAPIKPR
jgi:hypothetical protein